MMGFTVCDSAYQYDPNMDGYVETLGRCLRAYDAFADMPWPYLIDLLVRKHPDAYYIHTTRNEDEWFQSALRHFGGTSHPVREYAYAGYPDPAEAEDVWRARYRLHNRSVAAQAQYMENYLPLPIDQENKWEMLSTFLGRAAPNAEFPHKNQNATKAGSVCNSM